MDTESIPETAQAIKACITCGESKPLEAFPPHGPSKDKHKKQCTDCYAQHGPPESPTPHKRQKSANQKAPTVYVPPTPPAITPLFVAAGAYRFGLAHIALVDTSQPGEICVKLNVHENNGRGFPEALSFSFSGTDGALLLAALDNVTGAADAQMETLRGELQRVEEERDAALRLAEELEQRQAALRSALGI